MRLGVSSVLAFESLFLGFKKWTKASDQVIGGSRPGHCPGKILVSCAYCLYHYMVLQDDGAESSNSKDNNLKLDGL